MFLKGKEYTHTKIKKKATTEVHKVKIIISVFPLKNDDSLGCFLVQIIFYNSPCKVQSIYQTPCYVIFWLVSIDLAQS